jgi:hypothetical protein
MRPRRRLSRGGDGGKQKCPTERFETQDTAALRRWGVINGAAGRGADRDGEFFRVLLPTRPLPSVPSPSRVCPSDVADSARFRQRRSKIRLD